MHNTVIYPGTFDPITLGHEDLIKRAVRIFDRVIIGIGVNFTKQPLFTIEERVDLVREIFKAFPQVEVDTFEGMLVDFAKKKNANVMMRGLRVVSDFDFEFQMASTNRLLMPELETIFLTPADRYTYISSSLVREIILNKGDVSQFVSEIALRAIKNKDL